MRPTMPGEGVTLPRIAVDRRVWFVGKCGFNCGLRSLGNELVLLAQVHQQGSVKAIDVTEILLGESRIKCVVMRRILLLLLWHFGLLANIRLFGDVVTLADGRQ